MNASNQRPDGTLDARFLRAVDAWCARKGATAGAFGTAACRDRGFVAFLREGRRPRLGTVDRALEVMGEPPVAPAVLMEVGALLAVTGTKRSALGLKTTGNPSFVAQLLKSACATTRLPGYCRCCRRCGWRGLRGLPDRMVLPHPGLEVLLRFFERGVDPLPDRHPAELVKHSLVEAFHDPVGPRRQQHRLAEPTRLALSPRLRQKFAKPHVADHADHIASSATDRT